MSWGCSCPPPQDYPDYYKPITTNIFGSRRLPPAHIEKMLESVNAEQLKALSTYLNCENYAIEFCDKLRNDFSTYKMVLTEGITFVDNNGSNAIIKVDLEKTYQKDELCFNVAFPYTKTTKSFSLNELA